MFDDEEVELYSEILPALWQGGTEDGDNIYHGQKRLPTMGDPDPLMQSYHSVLIPNQLVG